LSSEWDDILDGSKISLHQERLAAWKRGEKIAPITIDMALLPRSKCNYACGFCYANWQKNEGYTITETMMRSFLDDCAEMGVKGISFVSDGESTHAKPFKFSVKYGHSLGIDMAVATNGLLFSRQWSEELLPHLTYLRVNFSGGTRKRYAEIMGVKESYYDRVCQNIRDMMAVKKELGLPVAIGMQMVLDPKDKDQIIPYAQIASDLGPDYAVIKHCSDTIEGDIGVDYSLYAGCEDLLREAESYSRDGFSVVVKWTKIRQGNARPYKRCYGPPFILQISGSGLVAPCGMMFNDKYKDKYHIGNIAETRFKDIVASDRYWEVMRNLSSESFDAQTTCGTLCLQHKTNEVLDQMEKGVPMVVITNTKHRNFI